MLVQLFRGTTNLHYNRTVKEKSLLHMFYEEIYFTWFRMLDNNEGIRRKQMNTSNELPQGGRRIQTGGSKTQ
jgi:hypothetical protein